MDIIRPIKKEFIKHGGVLKTAELNKLGLNSRQIKRLHEQGEISRIKRGFYELSDYIPREEVIIARLFPGAVIFLESALLHYGYTDRIPAAWQIAVSRHKKTSQYKIDYLLLEPYYHKPKFIGVGVNTIYVDDVAVKIYDRDRTMCDVLRYENKIENEVFNNAVRRYVKDRKKDIRRLFEYAGIFNMRNKVRRYIGVWL